MSVDLAKPAVQFGPAAPRAVQNPRIAEREVERQILRYAELYHQAREERAALRCALGDAAHLCDAIAKDVVSEHGRRRPTKAGLSLALIAERCGNAIWELRDKITDEATGAREAPSEMKDALSIGRAR